MRPLLPLAIDDGGQCVDPFRSFRWIDIVEQRWFVVHETLLSIAGPRDSGWRGSMTAKSAHCAGQKF
jgi:hypothetical protein